MISLLFALALVNSKVLLMVDFINYSCVGFHNSSRWNPWTHLVLFLLFLYCFLLLKLFKAHTLIIIYPDLLQPIYLLVHPLSFDCNNTPGLIKKGTWATLSAPLSSHIIFIPALLSFLQQTLLLYLNSHPSLIVQSDCNNPSISFKFLKHQCLYLSPRFLISFFFTLYSFPFSSKP